MLHYQKGPYRVMMANDGAIKVKYGDILGVYSMAIYGNPWTFWVFARVNRQKKLIGIKDFNLIYTGETLYHLPTLITSLQRPRVSRITFTKDDVVRVKRENGPPNMPDYRKKQIVKDFLKNRHKLTNEQLGKVDSIMGWVSNAAGIIDVLGTLGVVGGGLGTAAGFAGLPLFAISTAYALYDASRFDRTLYQMLCVAYTYTAWVFGDTPPTQSKRYIRATDFKWRITEYHTLWQQTRDKVLKGLHKKINEKKLNEKDVRLVIRFFLAGDNKQTLMKKVLQDFIKGLSGKPSSHVSAARGLLNYTYAE